MKNLFGNSKSIFGYVAAAGGAALVTLLLAPFHAQINSTAIALALLLAVLIVATILGSRPALLASLLGVLTFNFFFPPPLYTFSIAEPQKPQTARNFKRPDYRPFVQRRGKIKSLVKESDSIQNVPFASSPRFCNQETSFSVFLAALNRFSSAPRKTVCPLPIIGFCSLPSFCRFTRSEASSL